MLNTQLATRLIIKKGRGIRRLIEIAQILSYEESLLLVPRQSLWNQALNEASRRDAAHVQQLNNYAPGYLDLISTARRIGSPSAPAVVKINWAPNIDRCWIPAACKGQCL